MGSFSPSYAHSCIVYIVMKCVIASLVLHWRELSYLSMRDCAVCFIEDNGIEGVHFNVHC